MAEEVLKKLQEAGDAGYSEAGADYEKQVRDLVAKAFINGEIKGVAKTHNSSFLLGFHIGLDYADHTVNWGTTHDFLVNHAVYQLTVSPLLLLKTSYGVTPGSFQTIFKFSY